MLRRILSFGLTLGLMFPGHLGADPTRARGPADQTAPTEFSPDQWREIYLDLARSKPLSPSVLVNPPAADSSAALFLDHYLKLIEPRLIELHQLSTQYNGYYLLIDSGLFQSEEEKKSWADQIKLISDRSNEHDTDEAWKATVLRWAELAKDLKGELPNEARQMAEEIELNSFTPKLQSKLTELSELEQKVDMAANSLEANEPAQLAEERSNQIKSRFFKGELAFDEAAREVEAESLTTFVPVGKELMEKAGDALQRIAVLRSELAKAKGFKSWADFSLAKQASGHGPQFHGADQLLAFLYSLLDQTEQAGQRILRERASFFGRDLQSLRPAEFALLLPPADFNLYGYFPREKIVDIWRESALDSGFKSDHVGRILVDALPRKNKTTGAYMAPARSAAVTAGLLDGKRMKHIEPHARSANWILALTAIVQNFTDDALDSLRTMKHEGGHGLDYSAKHKGAKVGYSYGRAETPSTQAENDLLDREFLLHYAVNREGQAAGPERVDKYLRESKVNKLAVFRSTVMQAIFDIEFWRIDYSAADAPTLLQRAQDLNNALYERVRGIPVPEDLKPLRGYLSFTSSHFYSGSVTYYGYVLAEVGAELVHNAVLDQLEKETGRRGTFKQPSYAKAILPFYEESRSRLFPESIEHFTGKKFSAENFAKNLVAGVHQALDEMLDETLGEMSAKQKPCDAILKKEP